MAHEGGQCRFGLFGLRECGIGWHLGKALEGRHKRRSGCSSTPPVAPNCFIKTRGPEIFCPFHYWQTIGPQGTSRFALRRLTPRATVKRLLCLGDLGRLFRIADFDPKEASKGKQIGITISAPERPPVSFCQSDFLLPAPQGKRGHFCWDRGLWNKKIFSARTTPSSP